MWRAYAIRPYEILAFPKTKKKKAIPFGMALFISNKKMRFKLILLRLQLL